jgi:hypothetical protein
MSDIRHDAIEESAGPVFQPDTVLPSQFFAALREKGFIEGEKRLMAAVLADAVDIYMKQAFTTDTKGRNLFVDAEAWLFQDEVGPWFFSFHNICDMLGLEPEYIRRGLLEWRHKRQPSMRPSEAFRRGPRTSRPGNRDSELEKAAG